MHVRKEAASVTLYSMYGLHPGSWIQAKGISKISLEKKRERKREMIAWINLVGDIKH